jgi:hypothetical protein
MGNFAANQPGAVLKEFYLSLALRISTNSFDNAIIHLDSKRHCIALPVLETGKAVLHEFYFICQAYLRSGVGAEIIHDYYLVRPFKGLDATCELQRYVP